MNKNLNKKNGSHEDDEKNKMTKIDTLAYCILLGIPPTLGIVSYTFLITAINEFNHPHDAIYWDEIKSSSIIVTNDNNMIKYHLAILNDNSEYYDLINEYNIDLQSIITIKDATPYFVNFDYVQKWYSKDKLKIIINEFAIQDISILENNQSISNTKTKIKK